MTRHCGPAATAVVATLEALGARRVFGIPGVHNLALYDALREASCRSSGLRHTTARHECGAGFMADGYSRAAAAATAPSPSASVGVAFVISGPGLTNCMTAMGEALHDSIPMLVISTLPPRSALHRGRTGVLHELCDSGAAARAVAKASYCIESAVEVAHTVALAYAATTTGRPGPVHVEIPLDLLDEIVPLATVDAAVSCAREVTNAAAQRSRRPDGHAIAAAAEALAGARRPAIIAGGGSVGAALPLRQLAQRLGAAAVETAAGKGVVGDSHALGLGGRLHFPAVRRYLEEEADVILAVGTELSPTDLWCDAFAAPRAHVVQINVDAAQLGRMPTALGVEADAATAVEALLAHPALELALARESGESAARVADVASLRAAAVAETGAVMAGLGYPAEQLEPQRALLRALREGLGRDGTLVADMTVPAYLALSDFPCAVPRSFLHPVGFGTLGYALPAAIGRCVAAVDDVELEEEGGGGGGAAHRGPVAALVGDGGFQFTMQELAVAAALKLPLPIVVWNDEGYGAIRHAMMMVGVAHGGGGDDEKTSTTGGGTLGDTLGVDHASPKLRSIAEAYGTAYAAPTSEGELLGAVQRALASSEGPTLIEIHVDVFER